MPVQAKVKVLLCGDGMVGKTALRQRFMDRKFTGDYIRTIGADFAIKNLQLQVDEKDYSFKYIIWDLAGQPAFKSVRSLYYRGDMLAC